jgi:TolA-binding protein
MKLMMVFFLSFACAVAATSACGQTEEKNTTNGSCSPIVSANSRTSVTIVCSDVSKEIAPQIVEALNRIMQAQLSPKILGEKLDEIVKTLQNIDERESSLRPTAPQQVEWDRQRCNAGLADIQRIVAEGTYVYNLSIDSIKDETLISLRSRSSPDGVTSIDSFLTLQKNVAKAHTEYNNAAVSLQSSKIALNDLMKQIELQKSTIGTLSSVKQLWSRQVAGLQKDINDYQANVAASGQALTDLYSQGCGLFARMVTLAPK